MKPKRPQGGTSRAGVRYNRHFRKWQARIKRNGIVTYLGNHKTEAHSIAAREAAEIAMDGQVSGKMVRSAFDDVVAQHNPTPSNFAKPVTGMLPRNDDVSATPRTSQTAEELFAFIRRSMTLCGSVVFWQRDEGYHLVPHRWGDNLEHLLSFMANSEEQVVRHVEVAWMLTHNRPIPSGHVVKHSDGDVTNRDTHNLWLVKVSYGNPERA